MGIKKSKRQSATGDILAQKFPLRCGSSEAEATSLRQEAARWCAAHDAGVVYLGNPDGVREKDAGKRHNQRMGQWTYGRVAKLLEYKLKRRSIELKLVDERGTSGTCPGCGKYSKQHGRVFKCSHCGFTGPHRDVVGASGILVKAANGEFKPGRKLPQKITYLRPTDKEGVVDAFGPGQEGIPSVA